MSARKYYRSRAYWKAVEFIALNDEPADMDAANIAGYMTTVLASEVWSIPTDVIACDIVKVRGE